jgi:hypothetical protein
MKPWMKYKNQPAALRAARYTKHFNTLIPTLSQSKSVSVWVPKSQSPETEANLTIRPKTIISSMLVLIPVIHESKWYINFLCTFFHFAQWTQWHTVIIYRLFPPPPFLVAKNKQKSDLFFKIGTNFLHNFMSKFHFQTSGWKKDFKQLRRH